jgi:hypothetical protein
MTIYHRCRRFGPTVFNAWIGPYESGNRGFLGDEIKEVGQYDRAKEKALANILLTPWFHLAGGAGVEPTFTESESVVLPLNDPPALCCSAVIVFLDWTAFFIPLTLFIINRNFTFPPSETELHIHLKL